mmetsp:Transcript_111137/g.192766  ORF Transcript_111137/g.192766 Transcript_111137/m.192766 type:complete len:605 (-) Transcript_111137:255-2069(-)
MKTKQLLGGAILLALLILAFWGSKSVPRGSDDLSVKTQNELKALRLEVSRLSKALREIKTGDDAGPAESPAPASASTEPQPVTTDDARLSEREKRLAEQEKRLEEKMQQMETEKKEVQALKGTLQAAPAAPTASTGEQVPLGFSWQPQPGDGRARSSPLPFSQAPLYFPRGNQTAVDPVWLEQQPWYVKQAFLRPAYDEERGERPPVPVGPSWNVRPKVPRLPDGRKPIVAFLFSGQARSLDRTVCSIEKHMFQPLIEEGYEVHSFIITLKNDTTAWKVGLFNHTSSIPHYWLQDSPNVLRNCVRAMNERLQLKQVKLYSGRNGFGGFGGELLVQLLQREQGGAMIREWEAKNNKTVEWFVVARMDCVYPIDIPPLSKLPTYTLHIPLWDSFNGLNDRFALIPRQAKPGHLYYLHLYSALCWHSAKYAWSTRRGSAVEHIYRNYIEVRANTSVLPLDDAFRFARLRTHRRLPRYWDLGGSRQYWHGANRIIDECKRARCRPPNFPGSENRNCLEAFQQGYKKQEVADAEAADAGAADAQEAAAGAAVPKAPEPSGSVEPEVSDNPEPDPDPPPPGVEDQDDEIELEMKMEKRMRDKRQKDKGAK